VGEWPAKHGQSGHYATRSGQPASAWTSHAMMDYVVVRAFHRPAAYGVACLTELVIAHPRLIGLEIAGGLTYLWGKLV